MMRRRAFLRQIALAATAIFNHADIDMRIAGNRDFVWKQQISGAQFQRNDGGPLDPR
jgi:hypothetical protein